MTTHETLALVKAKQEAAGADLDALLDETLGGLTEASNNTDVREALVRFASRLAPLDGLD